MVERDLSRSEGSETVCFSSSQFGLIVETFNYSVGDLFLGAEPIKQEFAVRPKHARHFLHGFDSRPHRLPTPGIHELSGPMCRLVFPEELEVFLQEITSDRF